MDAAWLTMPLMFTGSRMFECGDMSKADCDFYQQRWHFWYIADYVYALPTVAFFMCAIGIFIISYLVSNLLLGYRQSRGPLVWQKFVAGTRYLSYRGFHVKGLRWNSASVGMLALGAVGVVYFFCMDLIPGPYYWADEMFGGSPPLATRSGWLALGCMPFIFATATKTNWITLLTGVSHERLQVFHRWTSYAFFVLALLHTFPFIVYHVHWKDMQAHFAGSLLFYWTGIVAIIFQAWLTFMSHSTIRSMGYEFFKITHFISAAVFMIVFFWHCDYTLTSWHYFVATAAVYVPCFIYPWLRTIFEYGCTQKARVFVEDNGFTRVTIPANFTWAPGQHCFLRFTGFGIVQSISAHPFTICSMPSKSIDEPSELVFYIRHRRGFTAKLHQHALNNPGVATPVMVDGPYGGVSLPQLHGSDRVLVIAGGSGAGWCLPFIESFFRFNSNSTPKDEELGHETSLPEKKDVRSDVISTSSSRSRNSNPSAASLRVVLATRDTASRFWFERAVSDLFARMSIPSRISSSAQIQVFVTGEAGKKLSGTSSKIPHRAGSSTSGDIITQSEDDAPPPVSMPGTEYEGRPSLPIIIRDEAARAADAGQSLSVYVCGPDEMQNDVRNAVAKQNLDIVRGSRAGGGVYLYSEHFSWA
ncbi:related to Fre1p and Fre2p [Rhynchosporium agropyri]|uniref:ferric-chelate reductase (NADPH) n=1 Tax=Rhynchosporium agropyri TaxID=914238 RepID=A0A1E1K013_9HELO|nr:related to Fre1p and Fre2p [Rhynchosporium agropyri]